MAVNSREPGIETCRSVARYMLTLTVSELKDVVHLLLVRRPRALASIIGEFNLFRTMSHSALEHRLRIGAPVPCDQRGVIHW